MFKKVLIPLNGSAWAEKALPYAVWLAHQSGAELILLRVAPSAVMPPATHSIVEAEPWLMRQAELRQEAEAYLTEVAQRPELEGLRVRHTVAEGPRAETVVHAAERLGVDAIVLATRARPGIVRWVLGSVGDHVVKHASVPVMLIRVEPE